MAERAKITWKGENPPRKLQTQKEEVFKAGDLRKRANESLDDLRRELYAQGVSPSAVSAQWQQARLLHDKILKNIDEYQSERDANAKIALEKNLKESLSKLRGDVSESVLDARGDALLSRTKDKSRRKFKKNSLDRFEKVFGDAMHEQTQEYLLPLQERQVAIRTRLNELEAQESSNSGIKTNREPEVLALEKELRGIETTIKKAKQVDSESTRPQAHSTSGVKESHDSAPDPVNAEHEVENDSEPSDEEQPRFNDGIRDAEFEDIVSDGRDLVPAAHTEQEDPERFNFYGKDSLDATPKEIRQKYRETVSRAEEEAVTKLNAQQESVKEISKQYFAALEADQKARGAGSKIIEDLTGLEGTKKPTKQLRASWIKARAEFALAQKTALDARLADRPKTREELLEGLKYKGRDSLDQARVRARYERMVTTRAVVMGAEEAELAVKIEGLSARDKTSLDRAFDRYKALPPSVRIFGTSAAILGLTTGASLILGGSVIGLVPLGMVGASAALRFWAEKSNGKNAKQWVGGVSHLTSIGGAFGAMSNYAVSLGHRIAGTERKAGELLAQTEGLGNLADEKNLRKLSKERKGALGVKESIARQGRLARILGSIGGGVLFGQFFGHGHHGESNQHTDLSSHDSAVGKHLENGHTSLVAKAENAQGDVAPAAQDAVPTPQPFSVEIQPGEGMDKLFVELREHYGKLYPDTTDPSVPPGIRHLLEAKSGDELSRELHFINDDNASYVMKQGDTLGFNEHGALVFTPKGDPTHSLELFTTDSKGTFTSHVLTPEEQQGHFLRHPDGVRPVPAPQEAPRVAESQTPVAHTETPDEVTARLNTEGRMGHPIAPSEAPSGTDAPVSQEDVAGSGDTPVHHDAPEAAPTPAPEQAQPVPPSAAAPAEHSPVTPSTDTADAPADSADTPASQDDIASTGDTPVRHDAPEAAPVPAPEQAHTADTAPDARQAPSDAQSSEPPASVEQPAPFTTEPVMPQESVSSIEHPFAVLGATPDLNPHGVDLNQPQMLVNEGRWFAHGTDNSDSYDRAVAFSQELSKTTNDSNVYFVTKEYDVFGREYLAVRMVFTPPGGGVSQMAPYAEGLNPSAQFVMPPLPKDADYQLPPK